MKKTFLNICFITLGLLIISNLILFKVKANKTQKNLELIGTNANYLVTEYNNKITVYHYGTKDIYKVLETPLVSELPKSDINMLKQGIAVKDLSDLEQLFEDYDG